MSPQKSVLDSIGNTPVVQLRRVVPRGCARVVAKLESRNPTGSMKDRMALSMVEGGERRGALKPGGIVVDYKEKPKLHYNVSMGIYVYEPRVLSYIEKGSYLDFPDLVLRLIKNGEKVVGFENDAAWLDIGRPEDYARAQEEFGEK